MGQKAMCDASGESRLVEENERLRRRVAELESVAERFRTTLHSIGDAVISVDTDGNLVQMNPVAEVLTGWREVDALGLPLAHIFRIINEETRATVESAVGRIPREGMVAGLPGHTLLVAKDGRERPITASGATIRNGKGEPTGGVLVFRDQTDDRRAEKEMRAAEERFRSFFDNAPIGKSITAPDGKLLRVNSAFAGMLGYSVEELQSIGFDSITLDDDLPECRESMRALLAGERDTWAMDKRYLAKDGRHVWAHVTVRLQRDGEGRPLHFLTHILDITEHKRAGDELRESEARFRDMFERSTIGKAMTGYDGRLLKVNRAFADMLGLSIEELQQLTLAGITHPDDVPGSLECVRSLLAGECTTHRMERRYRHRDGHWIFADTSATLLRPVPGTPRCLLASIIDVSERKRAEAERLKLEEQLRAAQRMEAIGLLAGGVAHDFNNLLSVILCSTEFAMERVRGDDRAREELVEVKKAGERAVALTRQLLAFGRKQVLQPAVLSLNMVASGVEKMLRRILGEDIDYVQVLAPDLGLVRADPGQIEQVLVNLVVNARDAMPDGGKLTVETRNVELDEAYAARHVAVKPGSYVQFTVSDTGYGMDKKTQARIFEPFFTTKERGKGTGLGLSTVYGIVKQSGGNIWVYSEPGQGTAFKVYLPRDYSPSTTVTYSKLAAIPAAPRGTETILLVEDEEAIRGIAKRILCEAGYTVLTAASVGEALMASDAHQGKVHLLLTDVVMPQMGGRVMAERLAVDRPEIKVLYMSGYADDAVIRHGTLAPGTHFISKPFRAAELTRRVREVLDGEMVESAGKHEQAIEVETNPEDRIFGDALLALPSEVLDRLWEAVIAARYDEIVALIETIRPLDPLVASRLAQKTEIFDYDGLRRLLSA
jgi:two-component system, cell cycle sensor histidine kinase and response regulator CckA